MQKIKEIFMRAIRKYLWTWYYDQFVLLIQSTLEKQYEQLMESIEIAQKQDVPIVMMINPATAMGLAEFAARDPFEGDEEEEYEPKKDNPFKIVEDEE